MTAGCGFRPATSGDEASMPTPDATESWAMAVLRLRVRRVGWTADVSVDDVRVDREPTAALRCPPPAAARLPDPLTFAPRPPLAGSSL